MTMLTTFIAFLSAVGIGGLLVAMFNRRNTLTDRRREIDISVAGEKIKADAGFFQGLLSRLEKVEQELKEMSEKLLTQSVNNARLEKENEHLKETNSRQETEINSLREKERTLTREVRDLKNELSQTKSELAVVNRQFEVLKGDFDRFIESAKKNDSQT